LRRHLRPHLSGLRALPDMTYDQFHELVDEYTLRRDRI
jgi:hypothetical protein